jgi:excisionase family DNA binding protein
VKKRAIEPGWVTTNEAAEATGYTPAYFRQLARRGVIPAERVGRDWFVSLEAALDYKRKMDALGADKHNPWRDDLAKDGRGRAGQSEEQGEV